MRRSGCLLVAVLLARGLAAQAAGEPNPRHNWVDHLYPAIWYSSIDGFWLAGHYDWSSPMGFAERPEPTFARVALDAGASTEGSYSIIADAQAPAYWDGWRFGLTAGLIRANRFGYYGQGNNTGYDRDSVVGRSYFYRVSRTIRSARFTVRFASSRVARWSTPISATCRGKASSGTINCLARFGPTKSRSTIASRARVSSSTGGISKWTRIAALLSRD